MSLTASAATDITADFTDPAFRAAVQELIGKEQILDTDVAGITELHETHARGIKSLAGLEYFISLEELYCGVNLLTELPATLPAKLKILYCQTNLLTELPALPSGLTALNCGENQLTALPVLPSGLLNLYCGQNRLTALDISGLSLYRLRCSMNYMASMGDIAGLNAENPKYEFDFGMQHESGFKAVIAVTDLLSEAIVGNPVPLTCTLLPLDTAGKTIEWSIDPWPETTGTGTIDGNTFVATAPGTVRIHMSVINGVYYENDANHVDFGWLFYITVSPAPQSAPTLTGPTTLSLMEGYVAASTGAFTVAGTPAPTVTKVSGDAKITWSAATQKLDIAAGLAAGTYPVELKASNGVGTDATITFTLTVTASNQSATHFWDGWPPALQWILQYILFGWIWMRWL